jgi:hypothetical protein
MMPCDDADTDEVEVGGNRKSDVRVKDDIKADGGFENPVATKILGTRSRRVSSYQDPFSPDELLLTPAAQ